MTPPTIFDHGTPGSADVSADLEGGRWCPSDGPSNARQSRRGEEGTGPSYSSCSGSDSRLGLSYPLLRPVPQFSINPFYWIGALTVVAFVIQAVTGIILLLWYVPDPTTAYSSTAYIFNSVNDGRFLETIHLYGAYAMILLAFMHMMRNYFVSTHKKPREVMWLVGMLMGFVTLGFGFTGYLLPWTVVSVDATNVGLGLLSNLPTNLVSFDGLLGVSGGATTELVRFYDIHIVLLPAVMLLLLFGKMYMLEAHGIAPPAKQVTARQNRLIPLFPNVTVYLLELSALFGVALLVVSAVFPYTLPAQYSITASQNAVPQPDWYFLWMYQILKIAAFEGTATPVALTIITRRLPRTLRAAVRRQGRREEDRESPQVRDPRRRLHRRAHRADILGEGHARPGDPYRAGGGRPRWDGAARRGRLRGRLQDDVQEAHRQALFGGRGVSPTMGRAQVWTSAIFAALLGVGSLAIGESIGAVVQMVSRRDHVGRARRPLGMAPAVLGCSRARHDLPDLQA